MQLFRPGANTIAVLVMAAIGAAPVLAVGVSYQLMRSPYATDQNVTRNQPVPFSHEHHVSGLGLDCRYCHTSVENARFAGMPPTETCMTCHSQIWPTRKCWHQCGKASPRTSPSRGCACTASPTTFISIIRFTSQRVSAAPPVTAMSGRCD